MSEPMGMLRSELDDPLGIHIDVSDLEADWTEHQEFGRHQCAACGTIVRDEADLVLLWRRGHAEFLALHWECARLRFVSIDTRN